MRFFSILCLLFLCISCANTKKATHSYPLNGTWTPIKQEIAGKELPAIAFKNQKLVIADSNFIFTAESVDKGICRYQNGQMDLYGKQGVNTGKHFMCIYKLENNQLSVCYNLAGDSYPVDFETKSKPTLFVCVYAKE